MISDLHFLRPWWLLVIVLAVLFLLLASRSADAGRRWRELIAPHLLGHLMVGSRSAALFRPPHLLALLLALGSLAAAGPTWQREQPPYVADTAPLVIAVDLSRTMDAIDISPSRLERAKLKIKDVLFARRGARTAIVAYAGSAHTVLPLTEDADLLRTYVDALATRIMPVAGKDTLAALKQADAVMAAEGDGGTVLLVTDGVEPQAFDGFREAANARVVLGVGTAEGGPVKSPDGNFLTGTDGARIFAKLDVEGLKSLQAETDAEVATITTDDRDVRWVEQRIRSHFEQKLVSEGSRWQDAGWWLTFPIALIAALSFRRGWVVPWAAAILVLVSVSLPPRPALAADFIANAWATPDQQGRKAFERGDFDTAAELFEDPMWRGTALYRAGKFAEAVAAFAASDTPESYYNQGNAFIHLEQFDQAVAAYREALSLRPKWSSAKFNLIIAEHLLNSQNEKEEEEQEPNEKADQMQFDDKGKKGKAGRVDIAEQTADLWMKNIQVSPADLMARKFALEAKGNGR